MAGSNRSPAQTRGQVPQGPVPHGQAPSGWNEPPQGHGQQPHFQQTHVQHSEAQQAAPQQYADDPMMRWALQGSAQVPQQAQQQAYHQGQHPAYALPPAQAAHDPYPTQASLSTYTPPTHPPQYAQAQVQGYGADPQLPGLSAPGHAHQGAGHQGGQQQGYGAYDRYAQAQPPAYGADQHQQPQAYGGQHYGQAASYPQQAAHADPQSWDLSQYATNQPPQQQQPGWPPSNSQHAAAQPGYDQAVYDQNGYPVDAYQQQQPQHTAPPQHDPRYQQQWQGRGGAPALDPSQGYAQPAGYPGAQHGHLGQLQAQSGFDPAPVHGTHGADPAHDQGEVYDEGQEEEEEAPRRGPRPLMVAAALVGAITLGGGLVYGYRMISGGKDNGRPPVVLANKTPAKTKPAEPGGKAADTGGKFLNRLGEERPTAATATIPPAQGDPDAPKIVRTLRVNPDGSLAPQQVEQAPIPSPALSDVRPPRGMVVEGLPPVAPRAAPPSGTSVADLPLPKPRAESRAQTIQPVEPKAKPEAEAPKKKPKPRDDALAPKEGATPAAASGGTVIGFVPVLTSKRTREEALKSFADLHQKFPDVLGGKAPDVLEAQVPDKGTYYRLIVGPPGSREAARDICTKLDAQGFKGCWATAYKQ